MLHSRPTASLVELAGLVLTQVKAGDVIPAVEIDFEFGPTTKVHARPSCRARLRGEWHAVTRTPPQVNLAERCAGKTVVLLGLPGAFTPC